VLVGPLVRMRSRELGNAHEVHASRGGGVLMANERISQISILLRVDTDQRRLECVIAVPDGSPHLETAFLIQQALSTFPSGWIEVPLKPQGDA
jgi:hypothetical protein